MNKRYIAYIFKNDQGHGLLSVFGRTKVEALKLARQMARRKGCTCEGVESYKIYAKAAQAYALDDFIRRNTLI